MHKERFTITEMAEMLAPRATADERATLHRQLRNLHAKKRLESVAVRDERGTALFDRLALYRARAFAILTSIGFDIDSPMFAAVADAAIENPVTLENPPSATDAAENVLLLGGLRNAIRGIQAGERWQINLLMRGPYLHGFRKYQAEFVWKDDPQPVERDDKVGATIFQAEIDLNVVFAGLPPVDFTGE